MVGRLQLSLFRIAPYASRVETPSSRSQSPIAPKTTYKEDQSKSVHAIKGSVRTWLRLEVLVGEGSPLGPCNSTSRMKGRTLYPTLALQTKPQDLLGGPDCRQVDSRQRGPWRHLHSRLQDLPLEEYSSSSTPAARRGIKQSRKLHNQKYCLLCVMQFTVECHRKQ